MVSEYYVFEKVNNVIKRYYREKMCAIFLLIFVMIGRIIIGPSASWARKGDILC